MESQADMNGNKDYFVCFELMYRTAKDLPNDLRLNYYDALMDYWLHGVEPSDPIIKSLLTSAMYSIDRTNEKRNKKSEYMKWNSNAVKTFEKGIKQRKSEQNREEQNKTYENKKIRNIEIENNKETEFELFWKEFPHARKWKKQESKNYFVKHDPQEVMKQVWILKRKIRAWLQEWKYVPACERWIRDFTPLSEDVVKQDLVNIAKWHLNCGWDIKQRATELKQTFGEQEINEIVKQVQQKNKPLF